MNNDNLMANSCLNEIRDEIIKLAALEENWNDEGAPVIDRACILRSQKFIGWLASEMAGQKVLEECAPSVFPTIEGGVELYWNTNSCQKTLAFRPGIKTIEFRGKMLGKSPTCDSLSETEAATVALLAMREAA